MAYLLFAPSSALVPLDARFRLAPFRDQKGAFDHVWTTTGGWIVLKHLTLQYTKHLSEEGSPPVPTDDAKELAAFTARLVAWPLAKDVAIISVARAYEWALKERVYADQPLVAASFMRGAC